MARQTRAAEQNRAVKKRTQERLAARKEAAQRGAETRRRNREAKEKAQTAAQAAEPKAKQGQAADRGAMATVALRGEQAERFRGLAAAQEMSLSKLLVRMMEVFEAQAA